MNMEFYSLYNWVVFESVNNFPQPINEAYNAYVLMLSDEMNIHLPSFVLLHMHYMEQSCDGRIK